MRKYWFLSLVYMLSIPVFALTQGDSILIQGRVLGESQVKLAFSFVDTEGKRHGYSVETQDGRFAIRVPKQETLVEGQLRMIIDDPQKNVMQRALSLFIRTEDISVDGQADDLESALVTGGMENNLYNALRQSNAASNRQVQALYQPIMDREITASSDSGKAIFDEMAVLMRGVSDNEKQFVQDNPNSYVSLFLLYRLKSRYTSDGYAAAYAALAPTYKHTAMAKDMEAKIATEAVTAKGVAAIGFERLTAEGKHFSLQDLKGRVFLLDFWGSWCGPCKASMPHLKDLYERYKDHGFEIVGVAQEQGKTLPESKLSWTKAIDELGIHWINVLNNEGKETLDIVKAYNISGFPTKILIDTEGKVILRVIASATDDIDVALKNIYGF